MSSIPNEERALLLATAPIPKLIWKFALPAIAAMAASSVYNIVAGIFIAHLGAYSIAGVGIAAPFMNLAAAFGSLVGVGASVLCSISLGEKEYGRARRILANSVVLNLIMGIGFSVVGLIFLDPILIFFGAGENTLRPAHEYMQIILIGNVFAHMYLGLNNILRVIGYPIVSMNLTFLSVVINIILAAVFIYPLDLGVRGAALATVVSQFICCAVIFAIFLKRDKPVYFEIDKIRPAPRLIKQSFALGSPNFFTNAAACFIVILQNYNLLKYGSELHVGAFSIINRVVFFFFLIILGFAQGMQPIVAYNCGAKQHDRMWKAFKLTIICAFCASFSGFLVCELFPAQIAGIFVGGSSPLDQELLRITEEGFRIIMAFFWIIAAQAVGASFFASMNQPGKSLFLSLTRQVIFIIPLLIILPQFFGIHGVWYTMPVSDVAAALTAIVLLIREYKRQKKCAYTA